MLAIEHIVSALPASPALLQLLLAHARQHSQSAGANDRWCAWFAPLVTGVCCACMPPAPVEDWTVVLDLVQSVSPSAGAELTQHALKVHPWSVQLWRRHHTQAAGVWR